MKSFVWILLLVGVAVASASNSDSEVSDPHTEQCKVGDTKFKDCNFCKCTNGAFECTKKKCPDREKRGVPVAADLKNTPCAPNDYFKIDCNTCYCNIEKTGYLCTENLCPLTEPPATDLPPNNNTITLNETITEPTVTNFNTTESINDHSDTGGGTTANDFSCTPGQTFKKDCNTCTCTPDGKNAVCTLKKCAEVVANATRQN